VYFTVDPSSWVSFDFSQRGGLKHSGLEAHFPVDPSSWVLFHIPKENWTETATDISTDELRGIEMDISLDELRGIGMERWKGIVWVVRKGRLMGIGKGI